MPVTHKGRGAVWLVKCPVNRCLTSCRLSPGASVCVPHVAVWGQWKEKPMRRRKGELAK